MPLSADGKALYITDWAIEDRDVVSFIMDQEPERREETLRRALRIGVLSLINSSAAVNVDYVEKEFQKLGRQLREDFDGRVQKILKELDGVFSGDNGALKKHLNDYLGDGGKLAEMFDPDKRSSVVSLISGMMEKHFGDRGSVLQKMLDPTDNSSPLKKFKEALETHLKEMERTLQELRKDVAVKSAQLEGIDKSSLKGMVFEELVLHEMEKMAAVFGDTVIPVGDESGDRLKSRKGDMVVDLNPDSTGGRDIRFVVEAKDTRTSIKSILGQLAEAMKNRRARAAVAVFARNDQLPAGVGPFRNYPGNCFITVLDKENIDTFALQVAYRAARYHAVRESLQQHSVGVDTERLHDLIAEAAAVLERVSIIKRRLTEGKGLLDSVGQDLEEMKRELASKLVEMDRCMVDRPSGSTGVA